MRSIGWHVALAVGLALALVAPSPAGPPSTAHAATAFTVTSTADEPDANPGDGQCASTPSGVCTLRSAVMETNALPGADTITVPGGTYVLRRIECAPPCSSSDDDTGAFGDLDLRDSVTINGAGATSTVVTLPSPPNALLFDRLFDVVNVPATVTIAGLTVRKGDVVGTRQDQGGGIRNKGVLALRNVVLSDNGGPYGGGGLYNQGTVTLTDVTFSENYSFADSAAGGAIHNAGTLTATRLLLRRNGAHHSKFPGLGGGLYNTGQATLTDAAIDGNGAEHGAGIANNYGGALTLNRVLVSANHASQLPYDRTGGGEGGGLLNYGTLTATNVTVSGNQADRRAGGIVTWAGMSTLTNVTLAENTATGDGHSLFNAGGTVRLKNTIMFRTGGGNCAGPITSLGNNIDSGDSCAFNAPADQSNVEPRLGPLQDNGGFGRTHALLPGSTAIDTAADGACPSEDQRGLPRPRDGNGDGNVSCDVGAFELQTQPTSVTCVPRPPVRVAVARSGPGTLLVAITASPSAAPDSAPNRLRALRFGRVTNATIDVGGQTGLGGNQSVTLPDGLSQTAFVVHRSPNGPSATVELVVVDDCGEWRTFVGGGPST